jgi:DNA-binding NarL/FixJ family response regulator
LSALQRLIDDEKPEMCVVATATNCDAAIALADIASPDVIVLDHGLVEADHGAVIPKLIGASERRVLMLSAGKNGSHESAILRGALGVVRKDETPEVLLQAIRKVYDGQLWLDRCTTGRVFELSRQKHLGLEPGREKLAALTGREKEVLRTLVNRPSADNKTLASSLHICQHTLRNHLSRIYDKLGVPNRMELYLFAQRHGVPGQPLN